jgi:hypothetical protein
MSNAVAAERGLHAELDVNRLNEQDLGTTTGGLTLAIDQRRRALEHRLELAKERLAADLTRASWLLKSSAGAVRKNLVRAVVTIGGLFLLGIVTAIVRRRRRLAWRNV